ncbi:hypothetical protein [Paenibacillus solani]|uniref:hypothetical protein n=1 Tax=Paenibacillus solani TaxID=1705565 RepID=UPI00103B4A57|nr:hypothetical protein [Paenibacillus solani]
MEPRIVVDWAETGWVEVSLSQACAWHGIARATYYRWKATRVLFAWPVDKLPSCSSPVTYPYNRKKARGIVPQAF